MSVLLLGLLIFLGLHSVRIVADGWRGRQIARLGERRWKGLYSLVAIAGFALVVWGFALARQHPVLVWVPSPGLRHLNGLFTLVALVLFFASHVPRNHFKAKLGHPMVAGAAVWAFGHLLAAGMLHDVVLFGAFLIWAVALFVVSRRRDRLAGVTGAAGTWRGDAIAVTIGAAVWTAFAWRLHAWLIGVDPLA